jgi:hypothetical protein
MLKSKPLYIKVKVPEHSIYWYVLASSVPELVPYLPGEDFLFHSTRMSFDPLPKNATGRTPPMYKWNLHSWISPNDFQTIASGIKRLYPGTLVSDRWMLELFQPVTHLSQEKILAKQNEFARSVMRLGTVGMRGYEAHQGNRNKYGNSYVEGFILTHSYPFQYKCEIENSYIFDGDSDDRLTIFRCKKSYTLYEDCSGFSHHVNKKPIFTGNFRELHNYALSNNIKFIRSCFNEDIIRHGKYAEIIQK